VLLLFTALNGFLNFPVVITTYIILAIKQSVFYCAGYIEQHRFVWVHVVFWSSVYYNGNVQRSHRRAETIHEEKPRHNTQHQKGDETG